MTWQGFYENCLRATKDKYTKLLNTPRGRGSGLNAEISEIIRNIERSMKCCELDEAEGRRLIKEFKAIDFSNLSKDRLELKLKSKKARY